MNLYEIDNEILDCVDVETGEIFDEDKFEALSMERDAKVENICLWIKNLKAEAEALKAEKMAFAERQKRAENKMEQLKKYITGYLDGTPFKTERVKVSFRKSESLEIFDDTNVPDDYIKIKREVMKDELKKAIKCGLFVDGAEIVVKQNIQIK